MSHRGHYSRVDDPLDRRTCPFTFGRDRDHAYGPRGGLQYAVDLLRVGVAHQGGLVGTAPHRREPRTLEVNPVEQAVTDISCQSGYLTK